jgi:hypothetical protein
MLKNRWSVVSDPRLYVAAMKRCDERKNFSPSPPGGKEADCRLPLRFGRPGILGTFSGLLAVKIFPSKKSSLDLSA